MARRKGAVTKTRSDRHRGWEASIERYQSLSRDPASSCRHATVRFRTGGRVRCEWSEEGACYVGYATHLRQVVGVHMTPARHRPVWLGVLKEDEWVEYVERALIISVYFQNCGTYYFGRGQEASQRALDRVLAQQVKEAKSEREILGSVAKVLSDCGMFKTLRAIRQRCAE